jgi:fibronectin-binding autotransporter adhesin
MKILTTSVLSVLITGSLLFTARADITTGLVAYWSLASGPGSLTVADLTGNGNTGTLKNFTDPNFDNMWVTDSDPTNGWPYALTFNQSGEGSDTYVSVPNSSTVDVSSGGGRRNWSISAWVNCSVAGASEPADAGLVTQGVVSGNAYAFALYMTGGKFTAAFRNSANSGGTSGASQTTPVANKWYHVVAVVDETPQIVAPSTVNSEVWIYVNGVQEYGTNANTYTTMLTSSDPVTIGCFGPGLNPFEGTIDEVRIYNRLLTASDVTQLYYNTANTLINTGIGYWNGLAGSTLDTTSANFCTNLESSPLGTPVNLPTLLSVESAETQPVPPSCAFGDFYYSNNTGIAVTSTNLTIAAGGVAVGDSSGAGKIYFVNSAVTYLLNSSDNIGIKDGANPTSLVQSGVGTVILTGTNTFSGGTTLAGTMQLGNGGATASPLGSGAVADNGTLVFDGNDNPTFANTISGAGSVTQEGTGTLTLGAINTYSGTTTITNGGTLSVSSLASGGTSSIGASSVDLSGGTLFYTGTGDSSSAQFNGAPGTTNTIDVPNGVTETLSGRVTGTAAWLVNKVDAGTLTLSGSGDNSFLGMNVNAGTVILSKSGGTGHAIGNPLVVASGATVQFANVAYAAEIYSNSAAPVTINSGGVLDMDGQTEGFDVLNLSGTGIGGAGALINSAVTEAVLSVLTTTLAANTTIGGAGSIRVTGPIGGSGSLTYAGTTSSTTLELQGIDTYGGGTFVTSGILDGNAPESIPGNVTVAPGATLELDSPFAMPPTATLNLASSTATNNLNFSGTQSVAGLIIGGVAQPPGTYGQSATNPNGQFTGPGVLNVMITYWDPGHSLASPGSGGTGSWDNTTSDWWAGGVSDVTWPPNNVAYFAGSTGGVVTVGGGVAENVLGMVITTAGYSITNSDGTSTINLVGNNPIISVPTGTTAIGCDLTGGGTAIGLTVSGPGTLILAGTNSYADDTEVTNGATLDVNTISDGGTSAVANTGNMTLAGGTLAYIGTGTPTTARTVAAGPNSTNSIDVPGGVSLTLSGSVAGATAAVINKTDTGTLILGGSVDNPGLDMNINGGEVIITKSSTSSAHGLGGGASSVSSGAELQLAGTGNYDLYSGCILTINSGGVLDVNSQSDDFSTLTLSGTGIGGTGALINSTTTTPSVLTNTGDGVVLAAATTVGGSGNITLTSGVSGSGTLTYAGTGTLTLSASNTYSGGTVINSGGTVLLSNSPYAGGTGPVTVTGTLDLTPVGNNLGPSNTISGTGIINLIETANNNLQLNGVMSGFTGTLNCPTDPGGTAKAQIISATVALPSTATINVANGGTFYVAHPGVVIPCPVNLMGIGNAEAYGALRVESNCVVSGTVTLYGNSSMGNGTSAASNAATVSGNITQSPGPFGLTFGDVPGTVILSGSNTYTGPTSISNGEVIIGGSGCLGYNGTSGNYAANITNGSGTNVSAFVYNSTLPQTLSGSISGPGELGAFGPGTLTLTGTNSYSGPTTTTNGGTLAITGSGCLGVTATVTNYAGLITNLGTFIYNSSAVQTLSGTISGSGALTQSGPGTLTLSGANTYTGTILINNDSTLALGSGGSIGDASSITIAAGSTFNASIYTSYTVPSVTTLSASGTGTSGSTAATIKVNASTSPLSIEGPVALTYTPQSSVGDATHPALYISQGALTFSASSLTVNNASGTPLGAGTYSLIQAVNTTINNSVSSVTVTGSGLAAGATASISVVGGSINMVVAVTSIPKPVINMVGLVGTNLVISGTNGLANSNYYVLTSTNLTLPLSNWTVLSTNAFSGAGTFSVTNTNAIPSPSYYIIAIP